MNLKSPLVVWLVSGADQLGRQAEFLNLAVRLPQKFRAILFLFHTPRNLDEVQRLVAGHNVEVVPLGIKSFYELPVVILRIVNILKDKRPAIIHSHHPPANFVNAGVTLILKAVFKQKLLSIHGYRNSKKGLGKLARLFERMSRHQANLIICSSNGVRQSFGFLGKGNVAEVSLVSGKPEYVTILNSVDVRALRALRGRSKRREQSLDSAVRRVYKVCCVASFKSQKNHAVLLRAFSMLAKRIPNISLVLIGDGALRPAMEELALELGLENSCRFMGHVKNPEDIVEKSDLFVLPSLWEGMPKALIEAMALGVPCVASRVEGVVEIMNPETLVAPLCVSHWVERMSVLLTDESEISAQIKSQDEALSRVDIDNNSRIIFSLYGEAVVT